MSDGWVGTMAPITSEELPPRFVTPPGHWRQIQTPIIAAVGMDMWEHKLTPLRVGRSISTVEDGSQWLHLSVSHPQRLPSWEELSKVKDEFVGPGYEAYQVLAKRSDHVNLAKTCLHLWLPMDGKRRVANLQDLIDERRPD